MPRAFAIFEFRLLVGCILAALGSMESARSQITLDGSFGKSGPLTGPNYAIGADVGKLTGPNLFHSFGTFNIRQQETATFTGPSTVKNIIGRVTGGQVSDIEGQIASKIAGADLYLINPAGWVFGPTATLHVPGSVHVSSADSVRFTDGTAMSARSTEGSSLTIAAPAAFGFMGTNPGDITVKGSTLAPGIGTNQSPPGFGKDLSLVGGRVTITGATITTNAGKIRIVSAAGLGDVGIRQPASARTTVKSFGPASVSGTKAAALNASSGPEKGGFRIHGGTVGISDNSQIAVYNTSDANYAAVSLRGDDIAVTTGSVVGTFGVGQGVGGAVKVSASRSVVVGSGQAGNPAYLASAALTPRVSGASTPQARSGAISITSGGTISLQPGGIVGTGLAAPLTPVALATPVTPGVVSLQAPQISITGPDAGVLSTTGLGSMVNAGPISLSANTIAMTNGGIVGTAALGTGSSGNITISTHLLNLANQALVSTSTLGPGNAGDISVAADQLAVTQGGLISSGSFDLGRGSNIHLGRGGNITLAGKTQPLDLLVSGDGSSINASASGPTGNAAGAISITAGTIKLADQGQIATSADSGGGGLIGLTAGQLIWLDRGNITTSVHGGTGNAGDIDAYSRFVVLNHGIIEADADAGRGGNIAISTQTYLASPDSVVQASAARGINGTIAIEAPQNFVPASLAKLSGSLLGPPALQQQGCSAVAESQRVSSLVVGTSSGLPRSGEGPQPASYFDVVQNAPASTGQKPPGAWAPPPPLPGDKFRNCRR